MHSCAVIGCGPAGIAASTQLRQAGLLVTCFELSASPGGMWHIDSSKNFSDRGLTSPLYPSMRCVLPKDIMAFSDQRFDYTVPQFPHHSSVKNYLDRYASAKGVAALTRFNTKVQSARFDQRDNMWKLLTVNILSGDVLEWSFDKVCVCTGQTQEPRFPKSFKQVMKPYMEAGGEIEHACYVKDFRSLRRKRIVVLGNGITAADYCAGLHEIGAEVYHSVPPASMWAGSEPQPASTYADDQVASAAASVAAAGAGSRAASSSLWKNNFSDHWTRSAFQHFTDRRVHHPHVKRIGPLMGCDGKALLFKSDGNENHTRVAGGATRIVSQQSIGELLIDNVDLVICATGYTQRYPFLHADVRRVVEEEEIPLLMSSSHNDHTNNNNSNSHAGAGEVPDAEESLGPNLSASPPVVPTRGLYLGTIYRANPSLAFVGMQKELLPPFLLYESQSRFVSYAFTQRIQLPSTDLEMLQRERALNAEHGLAVLPSKGGQTTEGGSVGQLNSSKYFNILQKELGVGARENYASSLAKRRRWLLTTTLLRVYHKFRSWAPLKRKQQHLLFSNKV